MLTYEHSQLPTILFRVVPMMCLCNIQVDHHYHPTKPKKAEYNQYYEKIRQYIPNHMISIFQLIALVILMLNFYIEGIYLICIVSE